MTIRLSLSCPHCHKLVTLDVGARVAALDGGDLRTVVAATPVPVPKKSKSVCACGHGREWHRGAGHDGLCTYGHGSMTGGCECLAYHARKNSRAYPSDRAQEKPASVPGSLNSSQRRLLLAIVQRTTPSGCVDRDDLAVMTGYARSTRNRLVQELARLGYVQFGDYGGVEATQSGRALFEVSEYLPTGRVLLTQWLEDLDEGGSTVLQRIADSDGLLTREALGPLTGYARSTRNRLVQELKRRRLVAEGPGGTLRVHALLCDGEVEREGVAS